jgi:hypothetical protein
VEQGKIAGSNMAGVARDYSGWVSMNVFHFFGQGAAAIGICNVVLADGAYRAFYEGLEIANEVTSSRIGGSTTW